MATHWRIVIVEDHTLFRTGLRALLAKDADLEVVGEADNGRDAFRVCSTLKPDLVLMDISMPGMNGIEAIAEIRRREPETRVIVLTIHKTDEYIHEALRAGANGYVLKDATHDELRTAIRTVLGGKTFLSPEISGRVISTYLGALRAPLTIRPVDMLTQRERQILKLVAEGHHNKEIAEFLSLSPKTVEKHRSNLMKKLDVHSIAALTAFAIANGLLGSANS
ncbi:MAG TPA: response regulator transcription factor [Usitatibacteraceae bacterium]|nr:response regulator transcription factor [Usitatibacteraceae bacterium]